MFYNSAITITSYITSKIALVVSLLWIQRYLPLSIFTLTSRTDTIEKKIISIIERSTKRLQCRVSITIEVTEFHGQDYSNTSSRYNRLPIQDRNRLSFVRTCQYSLTKALSTLLSSILEEPYPKLAL